MDNQQHLNNLRHSCAHLLAKAVREIWPQAKNAIGPSIENGFYQDFDFGDTSISDSDLPKIEQKMREIVKKWNHFEEKEVDVEEARTLFAENPYKLELIEEFAKQGKKITTNNPGNFLDLCKGGHVENPKDELKHFKIVSLAGAYWRGDEKNKMLTRIYGIAFASKEVLEHHLWLMEESKKRDHRKLGKELDLYVISELVGSGLPLFTPKGTVLRDSLAGFSEELQKAGGFQKVWIPVIAKNDLYKRSGHWDKFGNELFLVKSQETDDQFVLKPMNCPHHIQIYDSRKRSYRELPIRYYETTTIYRDEKAGELLGLSRVRSATQDDAHIFCRMDQIEGEFANIMGMIKTLYGALGLQFKARLSFRDDKQPEKYLGDAKNWEKAQQIIEKVAKDLKLDYYIAEGEAAFYGPKIDVMVIDSLGREWQCATEQLDFVQPARFELKYTDVDGSDQTPVMIHKALLGSIERFLSVYIEHTAGNFPLWISPIQVKMIPISEHHNEFVHNIAEQLRSQDIRVEVDDRAERMQKKIRDAQLEKAYYMLVVGDKEIEANSVAVRKRNGDNVGVMKVEEFIKLASQEIKDKVNN